MIHRMRARVPVSSSPAVCHVLQRHVEIGLENAKMTLHFAEMVLGSVGGYVIQVFAARKQVGPWGVERSRVNSVM